MFFRVGSQVSFVETHLTTVGLPEVYRRAESQDHWTPSLHPEPPLCTVQTLDSSRRNDGVKERHTLPNPLEDVGWDRAKWSGGRQKRESPETSKEEDSNK